MADPNVTLRIKVDARDGTATVEGFASKVEDASKRSGRSFSDVAAAAGKVGAAVAAAAAAVAAGTAALVRSSINTADQFAKMSQGVGLSVESLSTLTYAAERSGVGLDQLRIGLNTLNRNAAAAAAGTGEAKGALEALGITVTDTGGKLKSTDTLLAELADQFSQYEDSSQKAALAQRIFGESGTALIPLLNQGADGMEALQQRARDLGLEIGGNTAKQAEQFNDLLADGADLIKGFGNDLAAELLPGLVELARVFVDSGIEGRNAAAGASKFADAIKGVIGVSISAVAQIQKLGATTGAVAASIGNIGDLIGKQFGALEQFFSDVVDIGPVDAYTKLVKTGFENASAAIRGASVNLDLLKETFADIDADAEAKIGALNSTLQQTAEAAGEPGSRNGAAPALANATDETKKAAEAAKAAAQQWRDYERVMFDTLDEMERIEQAQRAIALRFADQERELLTEIALLGLSTAERQRAVIALEAERMARDETGRVVEEQADRYRELLTALAAQQEIAAAAADFERIWLDAANSVGDALTTALFDGAQSGADAIKDVMEQLARDLVRFWIQQKIVIPLQQQLVGGGPSGQGVGAGLGGGINGALGGIGALLGGAATGNPLGGALGGFAFASGTFGASAIGSGLSALGLTAGLGIAVPIVGALLGAALSSLFGGDDPEPRIRANASGVNIGRRGIVRGNTALGSLALNVDDVENSAQVSRDLIDALSEIDAAFVALVDTFGLGEEQMAALRDAAAGWSIDLRNSAFTAENVLGSRFEDLLATFDAQIVAFVQEMGGDLEQQLGSLSEALFIRAAAEAGQVGDTFDQVRAVLERFRVEGEQLDQTYARVVASTMLMEQALDFLGVSMGMGQEAFVVFANEVVEAFGGLDAASAGWNSFMQTFFTAQERLQMQADMAMEQAAEMFEAIGLDLQQFLGPNGLQAFRDWFVRELPNMTAAQIAAAVQAGNALGFLTGTLNDLAQIASEAALQAADAARRAAAAFGGGGGFGGGGFGPAPGDPGFVGPVPQPPVTTPPPDWWTSPFDPGGPGSGLPDAIDRTVNALNRWIDTLDRLQRDLLTDETLSVLTPAERLAEIERQYQEAFTGALAGDQASRDLFDQIARQFAEVGRDFFGSSDGYTDIFTRILADIGLLRSTAGAPATSSPALDNLVGGTSGGTGGTTQQQVNEALITRMDNMEALLRNIATSGNRTASATEQTALNTEMQQERTYG